MTADSIGVIADAGCAEEAHTLLREKLGHIPGVQVSELLSAALDEPVFEVTVEPANTEAEMAVYQAELEVYHQFPDARIQLYVV